MINNITELVILYSITFNTSELMVVADDLDDDDFHFLFRSELVPVAPAEPEVVSDYNECDSQCDTL